MQIEIPIERYLTVEEEKSQLWYCDWPGCKLQYIKVKEDKLVYRSFPGDSRSLPAKACPECGSWVKRVW